ncbi:low-density lipoprotein receptor class A domain-containing protein 2 [Glossophaga mutica]
MEAHLLQLPQRLLLLGAAALTASALETADLVDLCGQTWKGDGLPLRSRSAARRFYFVAPDTDCWLWVQAATPSDRIRFQFRFFLVYSLTSSSPASPASPASAASPASPESPAPNASTPASAEACAPGSYLQFYEGPPGAPLPLGAPVCGLTIPVPVASTGDFLGLRLVTRGSQPRVDFVGEVTSFRFGSWGPYFRCRNGRGIPPSLVCDLWGMDNCGDSSDQASWPPANCTGPSQMPSQRGVQKIPPSPQLPPRLSGQQAPLGLRPGTAPQQAGTLRNRVQLWKLALKSFCYPGEGGKAHCDALCS